MFSKYCVLFSGETLAQGKDTHVTREAIEELRYNLKKVLHFIDDLSGDIAGGNQTTGIQCEIIIYRNGVLLFTNKTVCSKCRHSLLQQIKEDRKFHLVVY